jgi:hypothetical protein
MTVMSLQRRHGAFVTSTHRARRFCTATGSWQPRPAPNFKWQLASNTASDSGRFAAATAPAIIAASVKGHAHQYVTRLVSLLCIDEVLQNSTAQYTAAVVVNIMWHMSGANCDTRPGTASAALIKAHAPRILRCPRALFQPHHMIKHSAPSTRVVNQYTLTSRLVELCIRQTAVAYMQSSINCCQLQHCAIQ